MLLEGCLLLVPRQDGAEAGLHRQGRVLRGGFDEMAAVLLAFYHCGKVQDCSPSGRKDKLTVEGTLFLSKARKPRERKSGWQYPFKRHPLRDLACSHKAAPPKTFTVSQKLYRTGPNLQQGTFWVHSQSKPQQWRC